MEDLRKIILENLDNSELNGEIIGRQIGMSRMNLHRKLKALTGAATGEFICEVRLERAAELLAAGRFNISEVAHRCGFSTPAHFATIFKGHYGVSPSEWLRGRG